MFTDVTNMKILSWIKEHADLDRYGKIINRHAPQIEFRNFPIGKNAIAGQLVSILTVTDQDAGDEDRAVVRIVAGNEEGHFTLESSRGIHVVRVAGRAQLDRELYQLAVMVEDKGNPPRDTTANLTINIQSKDRIKVSSINLSETIEFHTVRRGE